MADSSTYQRFDPKRPVWVRETDGTWKRGFQVAWLLDGEDWRATVEFAGRYGSVLADRVRLRDEADTPPTD